MNKKNVCYDFHKSSHAKSPLLTCVCDERQLFGPYFESLDSGSANRYSPSIREKEVNYKFYNIQAILFFFKKHKTIETECDCRKEDVCHFYWNAIIAIFIRQRRR